MAKGKQHTNKPKNKGIIKKNKAIIITMLNQRNCISLLINKLNFKYIFFIQHII